MKVAILGTRGVPPAYGGFETFAAELGTRLVERGHDVTVYCREGSDAGEFWNGIRRIVLPAVGHKYLETVSHTLLSAIDAVSRGFDAVLVCNAANAFVLPLLRAARIPVAINVDGIERKRRKWNVLGRAVYAAGEAMSVSFANRVIADADVIAAYYDANYGVRPTTIPYGAEFPAEEDSDVLERLELERDGYVLYVSRFEPENNPLEVVEAYEKLLEGPPPPSSRAAARDRKLADSSNPEIPVSSARRRDDGMGSSSEEKPPPLVMVGKGLYAHDLVQSLESHRSGQVRFPGGVYGRDYRTLQRNARLYIQATEVGGTHPALIEAMASGGVVLAHNTPENREVGGDAVGYFELRPHETLSGMLRAWLANPLIREEFRFRARRRTAERYSWNRVTDAYERLFREISSSP